MHTNCTHELCFVQTEEWSWWVHVIEVLYLIHKLHGGGLFCIQWITALSVMTFSLKTFTKLVISVNHKVRIVVVKKLSFLFECETQTAVCCVNVLSMFCKYICPLLCHSNLFHLKTLHVWYMYWFQCTMKKFVSGELFTWIGWYFQLICGWKT